MSAPEPTRPDPKTQSEHGEERPQDPPVELPPQRPRKPEIDLPKKDDGVTEEEWNRTPRR